MSKFNFHIYRSVVEIFKVWAAEVRTVFGDVGVMIFFFFLPTVYPIVYSLIYNTEVVRDIPVVVVDDSRTQTSREFARMYDATPAAKIAGYAADMEEARDAMHKKECYAILHLPEDFDKASGRGEVAHLDMYCDVSLLFRYRELFVGITQVCMEFGAEVQARSTGGMLSSFGDPMPNFVFALGNTTQGMASFLLPGILVLILQQSLVLGIMMLGAGRRERMLKNGGIDPMAVETGTFNTIVGRTLCYLIIYSVLTVYLLMFVPKIFSFPQNGDFLEVLAFVQPYILSSIFFGMTIQPLAREREDSFPIFVFSSVIVMFLSGLTWPRYAMSNLWLLIGDIFPSTWALDGFLKMNANGALISHVSTQYIMLWVLTFVYFIMALVVHKYIDPATRGLRK